VLSLFRSATASVRTGIAVLDFNEADTNGVGFHSRSLCGTVGPGSYLSYSFSKGCRRHSNDALKWFRWETLMRKRHTQVHLLSAFLHQQEVTVAQIEVGEKTNEIPEIKRLLEPMNIAGRVVTADAIVNARLKPSTASPV